MKYLLYCILRTPADNKRGLLLGVGEQPVSLAIGNGLSAAISRIDSTDRSPIIPRLLAYGKVVEAFHHDHTIIPMRYGCLFEREDEIIRHLYERHEHYHSLLKELDGCNEMGIRILSAREDPCAALPVPPLSSATDLTCGISPARNPLPAARADHAGRKYLAAREEGYAVAGRISFEENRIATRMCAYFSQLFVRSRIESTLLAGKRLLSLYFLVPRGSAEAFRTAFRRTRAQEKSKLLLSGPWPPYNFVLPDRPRDFRVSTVT